MKTTGSFTLPGESGYEELTLQLAKRWGADVIRDSDGTALSEEILEAGYDIYSTICIIRDHNEWAKEHKEQLQQTFLMTSPLVAVENSMMIPLMDDFFSEQFEINDTEESLYYWQVYDRTTNQEIKSWSYHKENKTVCIQETIPWHKYTVSFLAYRVWEEISMYNHTTNHWDKEHLLQIDPMHEVTREYLLNWMKQWCETHPHTDVVRFTSMFYNFVWIWGSNERNPYLYSDWASYDFTVSPVALHRFMQQYGYELKAEDFINQGKLHVTHMPATKEKRDWMEFINAFVVDFGKQLIDIVHSYGKLAYVFYDDSWVGVEPYHNRFEQFGFDGLIKCVFSGYEARLCAGVAVNTHELRLHPYLFPVGLGGAPTFMEGGNPTLDAKKYWMSIRRALLQQPIDRIGLGGYLHLVEEFPEFIDYIEKIADEFRQIKQFHIEGAPKTLGIKVAVLHYWGKLRSWSLSGHFHETFMHDLIHINESLAGLPVEVEFINFEDVKNGALNEVDVVINAGAMGTAWSGGDAWKDTRVVEELTKWVYEGGVFIGVKDPSAIHDYDTTLRMSHVLGVDLDLGERVCHGKWTYELEKNAEFIPEEAQIHAREGIYLTDGKAKVWMEDNHIPTMTSYEFGKGQGIYLASYEHNLSNTRLLLNMLLYTTGKWMDRELVTDNEKTECVYYDASKTLVVYNNSDEYCFTSVQVEQETYSIELKPYDTVTVQITDHNKRKMEEYHGEFIN